MSLIGHLCRSFLVPSQTFIYAQLTNQRRHSGIVLTRRQLNADTFPFPHVFATREHLPAWQKRVADVCHDGMRWSCPFESNALVEAARRHGVALLHGHFGTDARYFLQVARKSGLPLVATFHGYDASSFPRKFWGLGKRYLMALFREASAIITVSNYMRDSLAQLGCPRFKLRVVHVGVDLDHFSFAARRAPEDGVVRLLNVARLVPKKGHRVLLEALARLPNDSPPLKLDIVGAGPLRDDLQRQASRLGIDHMVTFLGHRPHAVVAKSLLSAHLFVQPSITPPSGDQEGLPTTLMEALASGLPVIASRHAGIPDLVEDGIHGRLVDEGDVEGLAAALYELATQPERWASYGSAGRAKVLSDFSARGQTAKLEDIYDEVLS